MIAALVAISAAAIDTTNSGRSAIAVRLSIIPIDRKNSPSRIDRNGSTSASSSCRYGLSASITPATNGPHAVQKDRKSGAAGKRGSERVDVCGRQDNTKKKTKHI